MRNYLKMLLSACIASIMLISCQTSSGPLLKGTAKFLRGTEFAINYTEDGNIFTIRPYYFHLDEEGNFEFDTLMVAESGDYEIIVGNQVYGVHLEKGKTTVMNIIETNPGEYACTFSGDNAGVSELMSIAYPSYDLYRYSTLSDDNGTPEIFMERLNKAHENVCSKLNLISDSKKRDWYQRRIEAMYMGTKARILQDKAYDEDMSPRDMPEYMEIINSIDPNDEISVLSYNTLLWIAEQNHNQIAPNMLPYCLETMRIVNEKITNENVKKMEAYYVAQQFFSFGDHETGKEEFWTAYKEFAKDYPEFIKAYEREYNKKVVNAEGIEMPEIELTKADDTTIPLSSLYGKYIYVDVWATWCGPCCKEIPHLEELVERMKDQDKVMFVSLSMDSDVEAWKDKIAKDKPEWAQYILNAKAQSVLSETLNIQGIPRFFIISPDGKVFDPETSRPSDRSTEEMLRSLQ